MAAHSMIDSNGRFVGDDVAGECKLNAPALLIVLVLVIDLQLWPARSWGLTLSGGAQREAPAQAELRRPRQGINPG